MTGVAVALSVLLLAACASVPEPVVSLPEPVKETTPAPQITPRIKSQTLRYLVGRNLKPIPDRALEVRTRCRFRDVAGGQGKMDLQVSKAEVKRFVAEVTIPNQGVCHFNMKDFQQTGHMPNVVLTDQADGCVVRMWEQGKGVTVAFDSCQRKCGGDAFSYLWPILVDTRNGRCT